MNWSGGKDSSLALHKVLSNSLFKVEYLLTSVNKQFDRVSMHGVRTDLLKLQAQSIGIPLETIELPENPTMEEYENILTEKVISIKSKGIEDTIFGDIFLEDLRKYREEKLELVDIKAHFPLWKIDTKELMKEFINQGFKAIVVCVNNKFVDKSFCGRIIDQSFVDDLPENVDVCGENGEYHSFVFDGPIFSKPVDFTIGEIVYREYKIPNTSDSDICTCTCDMNYGYYFCDLISENSQKNSLQI